MILQYSVIISTVFFLSTVISLAVKCSSYKTIRTKTWKKYNYGFSEELEVLTSTSHSALLLVAEVADCLPVVLRKTYCFFLWSSHVRNFSCSAWNNRTTSPCNYTHKHISTSIFRRVLMCFNCVSAASWLRCILVKPSNYKLMLFNVPTPLSIVSLLSLHFMNRTTFQLVLQFTELTWEAEKLKYYNTDNISSCTFVNQT